MKRGHCWESVRTCSDISWGPVAQFMPRDAIGIRLERGDRGGHLRPKKQRPGRFHGHLHHDGKIFFGFGQCVQGPDDGAALVCRMSWQVSIRRMSDSAIDEPARLLRVILAHDVEGGMAE